jgi:hypothetical protein
MRLECNEKGDFFVDPGFLSQRLCLTPQELQRRMRIGLVTSVVETGIGNDAGQRRITVRCGKIAWRAVVDGSDTVTSEELLSLGEYAERACALG